MIRRRAWISVCLTWALFFSAGIVIRAGAADDSSIVLKENVVYGKGGGEDLTLHLAHPKDAPSPFPVVVVIHGGGWQGGNKDGHKDLIQQLARKGYLSVSVGYRLAPKHRFPAAVEDVKCSVRWLRAHADELKLDKDRIGALGFSAGAHLSMMLGTMDKEDGLEGDGGWADQSSKVKTVVSFVGPVNLLSEYPEGSKQIVKNFIGGTKEEMTEAYRRASPLTYVDEKDGPMLLFQGTKDVLVPYFQAFEMAEALTKVNGSGRIEFLINVGHGIGGKEAERALQQTFDFFALHLGEKQKQ